MTPLCLCVPMGRRGCERQPKVLVSPLPLLRSVLPSQGAPGGTSTCPPEGRKQKRDPVSV